MQNLVHNYSRYYGSRGLLAAAIDSMPQRMFYHNRALSAGATCFYLSLCMVAPNPAGLLLFLQASYVRAGGYLQSYTFVEAVNACIVHNLEIGLVIISLDLNERLTVVRQWWHPNSNARSGLALVLMDDQGEIRPHWLPFSHIRDDLWVPLTEMELQRFAWYDQHLRDNALLVDFHPVAPVEADHLFRQAFPGYLDWQPVDFNLPPPPPLEDPVFIGPTLPEPSDEVVFIGPLNREEYDEDFLFDEYRPGFIGPMARPLENFVGNVQNYPDLEHPLLGIVRVVGVTAPPCPPGFSEFHFVPEVGYDFNFGSFPGFSVGPPSFWTRLLDPMTEERCAWQCRPSMIEHMRIIDGDVIYFHMEPVSLANPRMLVSGDYNPDFVSGIMTDGGLFVTTFIVDILSPTGRFSFYRLTSRYNNTIGHLSQKNVFGIIIDAIPFMRFSGEHVVFTSSRQFSQLLAQDFMPDFNSYPDRRSVLKTWCSTIAQSLPEEHKGKFLSIRNDALALLDQDLLILHGDPDSYPVRPDGLKRAKFNPTAVARDILSMSSMCRSMFVGLDLRAAGAALAPA